MAWRLVAVFAAVSLATAAAAGWEPLDAGGGEVAAWARSVGVRDGGGAVEALPRGGGLRARRPVARGEPLLGVPVGAMLYVGHPLVSEGARELLRDMGAVLRAPGYTAEDWELTAAAALLLAEVGAGGRSHWAPYARLVYDEAWAVALVRGGPGRAGALFEYGLFPQYGAHFIAAAERNFAAWTAARGGPDAAAALVPGLPGGGEGLAAAFRRAAVAVLARAFDWGPDARHEYALVPWLDAARAAGAAGAATAAHRYSARDMGRLGGPPERGLVLEARRDLAAGDEVLLELHPRGVGTVQALLQYGAAPAPGGSPHDYVCFVLRAEDGGAGGDVASVARDGRVPRRFVREVARRRGTDTRGALEALAAAARAEEARFSEPLERDLAASGGDTDERRARAYRVTAKQFLRALAARLAGAADDATTREEGSLPTDWPLRVVPVDATAQPPPPPPPPPRDDL